MRFRCSAATVAMMNSPLPSKRDLRKQSRRDAIITGAEALIRQGGDTSFSMLELAKVAGLSAATPYNLFGTKGAILYALLNRSADNIFAAATALHGTATNRVVQAAEALAEVLAGDPTFYRPLYAYLMGVVDARWRPAFMARAHDYWASAFLGDPHLQSAIHPMIVADLLVTQALGCVELWVHCEIEDGSLSVELCRSTGVVLLSVVDGPDRDRLLSLVAAPRSLRLFASQQSQVNDALPARAAP